MYFYALVCAVICGCLGACFR